MNRRFVDMIELAHEEKEFVRRQVTPAATLKTILLSLLASIVLVIISLQFSYVGAATLAIAATAILVIFIALIYFYTYKIRDAIFSNEFQNALFAGVAGVGLAFYIIIRKGGQVVYFSPSCSKYFTTQSSNFSDVAEILGLRNIDWEEHFNNQGRPELMDLSMKDSSGNKHNLFLSVAAIQRPKGYYVVKAFEDVANTSNAVVPGTVLFSKLFEEVPFGVYIASREGVISYVNSEFALNLGQKPSDLLGKRLATLVFGGKDFGSSISFRGDTAFRNRNGLPVKMFLNQIVVDFDGTESICGFARASGADEAVSDDGKVKSIWSTMLDKSPVAIGLIDGDGGVKESNVAMRAIAEKNEFERTGWNLIDVLDEHSRDHIIALLDDIRSGKSGGRHVDVKLNTIKGSTASIFINQVAGNDGLVVYMIDNTEQKNLEQRFSQGQKMQAVGQLAGGIAHDFNNLLTAMIGFCDLLLMRHPPGEQSFADIMQIKQNANRAANLVRQLLAFSRKQTLQPEVIDVTDTLAELSNLIRRLIGENIELKMEHGRDIHKVKVDNGQLEQVIINLAVNARDAMSEKGGVLAINTKNLSISPNNPLSSEYICSSQEDQAQEGDYVAIEIKDSGHGMTREIMHKIFEPFFTTKKVGEGTGLGLSTVYGIIKQTGGHIYVKSEVGKGTAFMILLKRYMPGKNETLITTQEKEQARDLSGAGSILLVEDEDPVRIFSSRALTNKGYNVLEADCGEIALNIMEKEGDKIDVIITDVVMPGITGPAMVERILKKHPKIKIIFISGYAEDAFIKTYGSDRAFNFLPKPYTLNQLAAKVKDVMGK